MEVVASLRTPDGKAVLYQSPRIQVRVHSDWETRGLGVVAVVLGLLLFVGLARGVRRGRDRTRIPPESVPDPDDIGRVPVPDAEDADGTRTARQDPPRTANRTPESAPAGRCAGRCTLRPGPRRGPGTAARGVGTGAATAGSAASPPAVASPVAGPPRP